ncbi:hypothetical protein EVAR_93047_1 [Eumeta japonica]|uniref:Uncharacterized protein n=1 Tax=Eumeta variegata TaxID=151549 RepID=A0A4C1TEV7_EUMVA|nr:hypothetical protein EVAR_93047_1 [Eumeta japonica]
MAGLQRPPSAPAHAPPHLSPKKDAFNNLLNKNITGTFLCVVCFWDIIKGDRLNVKGRHFKRNLAPEQQNVRRGSARAGVRRPATSAAAGGGVTANAV